MTWKAEVGSTIMLRSGVLYKEHVHFILNDPMDFDGCPSQSCMLVCATTIHNDKFDPTCVLKPGPDIHPFVTGPSYVPFRFADVRRASELEAMVAAKTFRSHKSVDLPFVRHLLTCLILSPRASRLHK